MTEGQQAVSHSTIEMKRAITILIMLLFLYASACSLEHGDNSDKLDESQYPVETTYYRSVVVSLPDHSSVLSVRQIDDSYYACLTVHSEDWTDANTCLYRIQDGKIESEYTFDVEAYSACILDESTVVLGLFDEAVIYDLETNKAIKTIDIAPESIRDIARYVEVCNEGFVVATDGCISKYDKNGELIGRVVSDLIYDVFGYAEDCIFVNSLLPMDYMVDWDNNALVYQCNMFEESGDYVDYYISGGYALAVTSHNMYYIDPTDCSMQMTISGDNSLFYPGKPGDNDKLFYPIDSNHYSILYNENGSGEELVIVEPDNDLNLALREKIVVGGISFRNDPYFESLRYDYNSSQEEYLVVINDYGDDQGSDESPEEFQLRLLRDFNEGQAPDIFYGSMFDYDYMGRNGIVIDLRLFFESDPDISIDDLRPCVRDILVNEDGTCYQLMAGYYITGYIGLAQYFATTEVSVYELPQPTEGQRLFGSRNPDTIIEDAIVYSLPEIMAHNNALYGRSEITTEQMISLIEFAVEYGSNSETGYYGSYEDVMNESSLLSDDAFFISQLQWFHSNLLFGGRGITYVGYPTVYGSVHPAKADCLMAISASAIHPKACWDFMRTLLSDNYQIQLLEGSNMRYPVISDIIDGFVENALLYDEIRPDNPYYDAVVNAGAFSDNPYTYQDIVTYLEFGDAVDSLVTYDFGLSAIIRDELNDYYSSNKSIEEIADSMRSRINLYYQENYT